MSELKRLTGDDMLQSKALYQESVMFKAAISLVIGSNMPLRLTETGEAIQRRLKNVKFEWNGKQDRRLMEKLLTEGEAIMGLIIKECGAYLADIEAGGSGFHCQQLKKSSPQQFDLWLW